MFKKLSLILFAFVLFFSCSQQEAVMDGSGLTLNSVISVVDLPFTGPITIKQSQMFSGNVLRSVISSSVTLGGETQELSSVFLINLDENAIYIINDKRAEYVHLTFDEFNRMMAMERTIDDTLAPDLKLTLDKINRVDSEQKEILTFGMCVPVDFELMLNSETTPDYTSSFKGRMWMSENLKNSDLFISFQKKSNAMMQSSVASNSIFFGLSGIFDLDENIMTKLNEAMSGIPVEAAFEITMPSMNSVIKFGISQTLSDYNTADIDAGLMKVPDDYTQVSQSEFMQF